MDCDICYEVFDHLNKKPLLLIRCAHTLCASCVKNLSSKKCPSCNGVIEDTTTNWSMLKFVVDSKFNKIKADEKKNDEAKAADTNKDKETSKKPIYPEETEGLEALKANDFKTALIHFSKLTELHPEYEVGHLLKIRVECELKNFKEVVAGMQNHGKIQNGSDIDFFLKGSNFYFNKKYDEAISSFKKAIEINPNIIQTDDPLTNIGLCCMRQNKFEEAIDWFNKSIKVRPRCAEAFCNKASTLIRLGKLEEAVINYEKALECRPNYFEALSNRGMILLNLGRYQEAIVSIDSAIKLEPNNPNLQAIKQVRSQAMSILGNLGKTVDEPVIKNTPAIEYKAKIESLLSHGKHDEAKKVYIAGLKLEKTMFDQWPEIKKEFPSIHVT